MSDLPASALIQQKAATVHFIQGDLDNADEPYNNRVEIVAQENEGDYVHINRQDGYGHNATLEVSQTEATWLHALLTDHLTRVGALPPQQQQQPSVVKTSPPVIGPFWCSYLAVNLLPKLAAFVDANRTLEEVMQFIEDVRTWHLGHIHQIVRDAKTALPSTAATAAGGKAT